MGRTCDGGWQMIKDAVFGDLAVWSAGAPDQDYRVYGRVWREALEIYASRVKFCGPVVGARLNEGSRGSRWRKIAGLMRGASISSPRASLKPSQTASCAPSGSTAGSWRRESGSRQRWPGRLHPPRVKHHPNRCGFLDDTSREASEPRAS